MKHLGTRYGFFGKSSRALHLPNPPGLGSDGQSVNSILFHENKQIKRDQLFHGLFEAVFLFIGRLIASGPPRPFPRRPVRTSKLSQASRACPRLRVAETDPRLPVALLLRVAGLPNCCPLPGRSGEARGSEVCRTARRLPADGRRLGPRPRPALPRCRVAAVSLHSRRQAPESGHGVRVR